MAIEYGDVEAKVANAISAALEEGGDFVIKWVMMVEVLDSDGDRGLWALASKDAMPWDTLGMLEYATNRERAASIVNVMLEAAEVDGKDDDD